MSIKVYTRRTCSYCVAAKQLLRSKGVEFEEIGLDNDPQLLQEVMTKARQRTVPQIWIGSRHVGGFTDMLALDRAGELDGLLANPPA
ncbi:MAG TPA: glutaredoxin 3 [Cellvibrionaceae bacterium]|nr:glutaredoxin 3 [Cellvibrionaceae bacterium]HNG61752.1 glutaredoxin 3 [Cellvibrionaceae bacterium]